MTAFQECAECTLSLTLQDLGQVVPNVLSELLGLCLACCWLPRTLTGRSLPRNAPINFACCLLVAGQWEEQYDWDERWNKAGREVMLLQLRRLAFIPKETRDQKVWTKWSWREGFRSPFCSYWSCVKPGSVKRPSQRWQPLSITRVCVLEQLLWLHVFLKMFSPFVTSAVGA